MTDPEAGRARVRAELARLSRAYLVRLSAERADLEALSAAVVAGAGDDERRALRSRAHKLAGTAGTFGFAALSAAALAVERHLEASPADGLALGERVEELLTRLREAIAAEPG